MAKTFNRQPYSVAYPTDKQMKDYFFNHYQWKGINDDKNFLEVDQYTFNEAKNVYIDSEGLLRSRPSLKKKTIKAEIPTGQPGIYSLDTLDNIINFWIFGDIAVYLNKVSGTLTYKLYFVNKYANSDVNYECYANPVIASTDLKLVLSKRKIYVFTTTSLSYFDMDTLEYYVSTDPDYVDPVYIPTTKSITKNTTTDIESPNILTNKQYYTYLYSSILGVNDEVIDKDVTIIINGTEYPITFTKYTPLVIANTYITIDTKYNNTGNTSINMAISKDNVVAMYSESNRVLTISVDGKTFDSYQLPDSAGTVRSNIKFSQDGAICYLITTVGIYVISVYADTATGAKEYPSFYDITKSATYSTLNSLSFATSSMACVFADFVTSSKFVIYYQNGSTVNDDFHLYFADGDVNPSVQHWTMQISASTAISLYSAIDGRTMRFMYNNQTVMNYTYSGTSYVSKESVLVAYGGKFIIFRCASWGNVANYSVIEIFEPRFTNNVIYFSGSGIYDYYISGQDIYLGFTNSTTGAAYCGIVNYTVDHLQTTTRIVQHGYIDTNNFYSVTLSTYDQLRFFNSNAILVYSGGLLDFSGTRTNFIIPAYYVVATTNYIYYVGPMSNNTAYTTLYSTNVQDTIEIRYLYDPNGTDNYIVPEHIAELHNFYFAIDNAVMITSDRTDSDGNWQWYFPENQRQEFNYDITALRPVSDVLVSVFMEPEVDYITYDTTNKAYTYQKSKLQLGLPDGNNVITSLDGTNVIFVTKRGLVSLGYQDFIASTEQALSYLSDGIFQVFNDWNTSSIRLHLHGFWLICYKPDHRDCYVYDIRNKSWWFCEYNKHDAIKFVTDGTELMYFADGIIFDFDRKDVDYFDYDGTESDIDWLITSQKLYLNAANYYKHIINITLNIALDTIANNDGNLPTMNLDICNYRKERNVVGTEEFTYQVDMIRTFVKRLNYFKVCEFQYKLSSDLTNKRLKVPLSLADITVKYKLAGEIR